MSWTGGIEKGLDLREGEEVIENLQLIFCFTCLPRVDCGFQRIPDGNGEWVKVMNVRAGQGRGERVYSLIPLRWGRDEVETAKVVCCRAENEAGGLDLEELWERGRFMCIYTTSFPDLSGLWFPRECLMQLGASIKL